MHEGFDPLAPEFLADPFAVRWRDEPPVFYAPSLDYYVVTRYADVERGLPRPGDVLGRDRAAAAGPARAGGAARSCSTGGHRPQPSMVSLDPPAHTRLRRPAARAFTPRRVTAMEPRIRATVDELLDAVDASARRSTSSPRSRSRCRRAIDLLVHGRPARATGRAEGVVRQPRDAGLGAAGARGAGRRTRSNMAAYRGYLRGLVAAKVDDRADDFASALLAIHDEDPEALTPRGDRLDPVLAQLRRPRDDELPDRQRDPAPARGPVAVGARSSADPSLIPQRRRRDAPLRPVRPGLAAGHDAGDDARRRRPARGREALPLAGRRGPRSGRLRASPTRSTSSATNAAKHLAFGKGIHYCAGAALGKLEAQCALEALAQPLPRAAPGRAADVPVPPEHLVPRPAPTPGSRRLIPPIPLPLRRSGRVAEGGALLRRYRELTSLSRVRIPPSPPRRGGRAVECGGLENRYPS